MFVAKQARDDADMAKMEAERFDPNFKPQGQSLFLSSFFASAGSDVLFLFDSAAEGVFSYTRSVSGAPRRCPTDFIESGPSDSLVLAAA